MNDIDPAIIGNYDKWLHALANRVGRPEQHDDLVQEGRIAMWRALESFNPALGSLPAWLVSAAERRLLSLVTGHARHLGDVGSSERTASSPRGREARQKIREHLADHPGASGVEISRATGLSTATVSVQRKQLDIDTPPHAPASLDALKDVGYDPVGDGDPEAFIEAAYMSGRVGHAMEALTENQRRYVRLRFWGDLTPAELRAEFGYDPASIWREAKSRMALALAG